MRPNRAQAIAARRAGAVAFNDAVAAGKSAEEARTIAVATSKAALSPLRGGAAAPAASARQDAPPSGGWLSGLFTTAPAPAPAPPARTFDPVAAAAARRARKLEQSRDAVRRADELAERQRMEELATAMIAADLDA